MPRNTTSSKVRLKTNAGGITSMNANIKLFILINRQGKTHLTAFGTGS